MSIINKIPDTVHYYYIDNLTKCYVGAFYDYRDDNKTYENVVKSITVFDNDKSKTAENWIQSEKNSYRYDPVKKEHIYDLKDKDTEIYSRKNIPISNLKLMHLDHRGRGGRAYKVVHTAENGIKYLFDMREEQVVDCMLHEGCKNGIFLSKFIWAKVHTQNKLVRVGSKLYNEYMNI